MALATSVTLLERVRDPGDGMAWQRFYAFYATLRRKTLHGVEECPAATYAAQPLADLKVAPKVTAASAESRYHDPGDRPTIYTDKAAGDSRYLQVTRIRDLAGSVRAARLRRGAGC
jgi:hypothetical protein